LGLNSIIQRFGDKYELEQYLVRDLLSKLSQLGLKSIYWILGFDLI